MKHALIICIAVLFLCGCTPQAESADLAATTLPVYEFTTRLCEGTPLTTTRLVTEEVSCLHDYALNVNQVKSAEAADTIIISGAGLEEFMEDLLIGKATIDASEGIALLCPVEEPDHDHGSHEGHHHESDPHIWLSPEYAKQMVQNICNGLSKQYPQYTKIFSSNLRSLVAELDALQSYGNEALSNLSCREIITFHDGFSYFA